MSANKKPSLATIARNVVLQYSATSAYPDPSLIIPRLYLGDIIHAKDITMLRRLGVTHVLSIIEEDFDISSETADKEDIEYCTSLKRLHIPLEDKYSVDILSHLDDSTSFISEALDNPNSVILVHCFMGMSRSATAVGAFFLATTTKYSCGADVVRFLKSKRQKVSPNWGFIMQLDKYTTLWNERRAKAAREAGSDKEKGTIKPLEPIISKESWKSFETNLTIQSRQEVFQAESKMGLEIENNKMLMQCASPGTSSIEQCIA